MEDQVPEVERALSALYGTPRLLTAGVVHVSSAVRGPDGRLRVIKIGPRAPQSETDFFVLNLCRARCDAILTTAAIVRSEPMLQHALAGPYAAALARYRHEGLGKVEPPVCAILTRSSELPLEHPVWLDGTRKEVLTTPAVAPGLARRLGARARVRGLEPLDARAAVGLLQAAGAGLISVEAGPSTTAPLYEGASLVDELLLSLYEGASKRAGKDEVELGGELPAALLYRRVCVAETRRDEASGRWCFQRWLRHPG